MTEDLLELWHVVIGRRLGRQNQLVLQALVRSVGMIKSQVLSDEIVQMLGARTMKWSKHST